MKKKDFNNLKTKNIKDLKKTLNDLRKENTKMRLELKLGKNKNVHALSQNKKDISRVLTILSINKLNKEKEKENGTS